MFKIAGIVFQSKGVTLSEVARVLAVSRTTAMKWLALMESDELLVRTHTMSGMRGRPQVVYRPTSKLTKLVEIHSSGSIAILSFPTLRSMCKHSVEGSCNIGAQVKPCAEAICPLVHK